MKKFREFINTSRGLSVVWAVLVGICGITIGVLGGFSILGICAFSVVVILLAIPLLLDDEKAERYFRFLARFS